MIPAFAAASLFPQTGENFFIFPLAGEKEIWYHSVVWKNVHANFKDK